MLTPEQKLHFDTFGFIVLRQAFSPGEMAQIGQAFDDILAADRQGRAFDGVSRMFTMNFSAKPTEESHIQYLQRVYQSNLKHVEQMQFL